MRDYNVLPERQVLLLPRIPHFWIESEKRWEICQGHTDTRGRSRVHIQTIWSALTERIHWARQLWWIPHSADNWPISMTPWSSWASLQSHLYNRGELRTGGPHLWFSLGMGGVQRSMKVRREILLPVWFFLKELFLFSWHSLACEYIWVKPRG